MITSNLSSLKKTLHQRQMHIHQNMFHPKKCNKILGGAILNTNLLCKFPSPWASVGEKKTVAKHSVTGYQSPQLDVQSYHIYVRSCDWLLRLEKFGRFLRFSHSLWWQDSSKVSSRVTADVWCANSRVNLWSDVHQWKLAPSNQMFGFGIKILLQYQKKVTQHS